MAAGCPWGVDDLSRMISAAEHKGYDVAPVVLLPWLKTTAAGRFLVPG